MTGYLVFAARCCLVTVLLLSSATKLPWRGGFSEFLNWVRDLTVVPRRWVVRVGVLMVAVEAITLLLLLLPVIYAAGLVLSAVIMAFFAGSAVFLVSRGIAVPCRCFGAPVTRRPMGPVEIARNTALCAIATTAAVIVILDRPPLPPTDTSILAALLGGAVGLVSTRLDDLRQLYAS
jgi:hypothetical protein